MTIEKEVKNFNMPWENSYGYSQAVKVKDTIYISGQVSHDDNGEVVGVGDMQVQMSQAYENIKKLLSEYRATIDNLVDETLFVTDMDSAFKAATEIRKKVFSGNPNIASTIVQIDRLAFPELMIEIKCVVKI